jgi:ferredoxin-NADP reductase
MEVVSQRAPGRWQIATVTDIKQETPRVKSFTFELPMWMPHLPGQHYDVRLSAPDGYVAERSYSIASSPLDKPKIQLTIDRLEDGEVSPYFHDVVQVGDQVEVRGPFASYFVWRGESPVLLVGGGSGVVPLMAMLRQARRAGRADLLRVLVSARSPADLYYADELPGDGVRIVYTRAAPPDDPRGAGRMTLADLAPLVRAEQDVYVCGSPAFADAATERLREAGVPDGVIRVERFGPSG